MLQQLSQLSEAETRKISGRAYGGAAQHDDDSDDSEDGATKTPVKPAEKRGRGRPKKIGGDAETKSKYEFGKGLQDFIIGNLPKDAKGKPKLPGKPGTKHTLKDWVEQVELKYIAEESEDKDKGRPYVCVHAKKGKCNVTAKSSYEAAQQAAKKWGLKSTAGIDCYLADVTHKAVNERKLKETAPGQQLTVKPMPGASQLVDPATQKVMATGDAAAVKNIQGAVAQGKVQMRGGAEDMAEGLDPDTQRLEQEVRDALANGDDYKAKSLVKMAQTAADRNYLRKIIRQEMYGTGPGQGGVAEAAKWRRNDLEGKTWRSTDWDEGSEDEDAEPERDAPLGLGKIAIDRDGKDVDRDNYGDELRSRPGSWRGITGMAKRMTKKGVPTKSELGYQHDLKMHMKKQQKRGGLTGPKGQLPEEQAVTEGRVMKSHMDETEYSTYNGWKAACRRAGADRFDGDRDICQAMRGNKGVGEWDGDVGTVYGDAHKKDKQGVAEADIPSDQMDMGAGLGAGRSSKTFEGKKPDFLDLDKDKNKKEPMSSAAKDAKKKTKIKESMHRHNSAKLLGKAHALAKEGYNCKFEDLEEVKMYHEGYKEGLDECYGQGVYESPAVPPATLHGMADQAMEDTFDEGNAFTGALARTPKGGSFTVGGKSFIDRSSYDSQIDEFAFESLDKQLNALLEDKEVTEGMTVSISKGQQGTPDSVTVSAQDGEADELLGLIKQAGLGLFGNDGATGYDISNNDQVSDSHGDIKVVGDHDGMMSIMKKLAGTMPTTDSDHDYADEKGHDHGEEAYDTCGQFSGECEEQQMHEVETPDQEEAEVAESNPPDSGAEETTADENAEADEDRALANADEEGEEQVTEWANDAGKRAEDFDDESFQTDLDFITQSISGGLNKPKSTGQTTIPVIAGQTNRMETHESITDWKKLAGI